MSAYLYISGNGIIPNFGSLKNKAAATALEKKIEKGTAKNFTEKDADVLKGIGGMTPGDSDEELRILDDSENVLFSIDNLYDLPELCFKHRFIKIDSEEHPFVWRSDVETHGDFFLYEDEDGDFDEDSDESDFLSYLKEYLRIQVMHVFFGDVEVAQFVDGVKFGEDGIWFEDVASWDPENYEDESYDIQDNFPLRFHSVKKSKPNLHTVYKASTQEKISIGKLF